MTDTPRTDAVAQSHPIYECKFDIVKADFARQLERENAALKAMLKVAEDCVEAYAECGDGCPCEGDQHKYARETLAQLATLKEQK